MSAVPLAPRSARGPSTGADLLRVTWDASHALDTAGDPARDPAHALLVWRVWRHDDAWLASAEIHTAGGDRSLTPEPLPVVRSVDEPTGIEHYSADDGRELLLCIRGERLLLARSAWLARLDPRGGRLDRPALARS